MAKENLFTCIKCEAHYNVSKGTKRCPVCGKVGEDDYTRDKKLKEDAGVSNSPVSTNAVGGGKIAGIGVGPDGEPPKKKKTKLLRNILKRKI